MLFMLKYAIIILLWIYFRNQNMINTPWEEHGKDTCHMWLGIEIYFNIIARKCWYPLSKFIQIEGSYSG